MGMRENREFREEEVERVLFRAVEYYFQGLDAKEAISISLKESEEIIGERNKNK
ncbi:hypothetical protein ACQPUZ_09060 [Clostridium tertium]